MRAATRTAIFDRRVIRGPRRYWVILAHKRNDLRNRRVAGSSPSPAMVREEILVHKPQRIRTGYAESHKNSMHDSADASLTGCREQPRRRNDRTGPASFVAIGAVRCCVRLVTGK